MFGCRITGAVVSSDPVVTGPAVLTRIRFTLVNVRFAMKSYKGNKSSINIGFMDPRKEAEYFGVIFINSFHRPLPLYCFRIASIVLWNGVVLVNTTESVRADNCPGIRRSTPPPSINLVIPHTRTLIN